MATTTVTPFERQEIELEESDYYADVTAFQATGAGWMAVLAYKARYRLAQGWASLKQAGNWIVENLVEAAYWTVSQLRRAGRWLLAAAARAKTAIATSAVAIWTGVTASAGYLWDKAVISSVYLKAKALAGAGGIANWMAVPTQFVVGSAAALGGMFLIGGTGVLLLTIAAATVLVIGDRVIPVPEGRLRALKNRVHDAVTTGEAVQLDYDEAQSAMEMLEVESRVNDLTERLTAAHETDNVVEISELSGRQYLAQNRQVGVKDSVSALFRQFYAQHTNIYGDAVDVMYDWDAVRAGMKLEHKYLASVQNVPSEAFAERMAQQALDAMDVSPAKKAAAKKTAVKKTAAKKATPKKRPDTK